MLARRGALSDIRQYMELKRLLKERCGKLQTNCPVGMDFLASPISRGLAEYEEANDFILIFVDEGAFTRVYYLLKDRSTFPVIEHDGLLVLDEVDVNGRRREKIGALELQLLRRDWRKLAINIQVSANLTGSKEKIHKQHAFTCSRINAKGFSIEFVSSQAQASRVLELWTTFLKTTDVPLDHREFLDDPNQKVACVIDENNLICGVNWWRCRGGICEVRHTVTDPRYQHQGIGYALLLAALNDAIELNCGKIFTYIDETNITSLGLYAKAGFAENGRLSVQFAKEKGLKHG